MKLLLTASEDRATLESDLSAGTGVSGKGDAIVSLFFCTALRRPQHHPFTETTKRKTPGVWGQRPQ